MAARRLVLRKTSFSERVGAVAPRLAQVDSMDAALRRRLFNVILGALDPVFGRWITGMTPAVIGLIWCEDLGRSRSALGTMSERQFTAQLESLFNNSEWHEVYTFV